MAAITRTYQQTLLLNYLHAIQAFVSPAGGAIFPYLTKGQNVFPMRVGPRHAALGVGSGFTINPSGTITQGTGYQVGDILTGSFVGQILPVLARVLTVGGAGNITSYDIIQPGLGNVPSLSTGNSPAILPWTGGHGTGASLGNGAPGGGVQPQATQYGYPQPAA